jgi:formylglycine-generating enzyme required for sulfatase activity
VADNNPSHFQGYQLPVDQVSWDDAQAYCKGVEMRLPTEAEWEYAARGGSAAARDAPLERIAWYDSNSGNTTHEVGQKQANGYGLYDMLGNLWEWTADWLGPYAAAGAMDPKGPQTGRYRVLRGGAWSSRAFLVRVSARSWDVPEDAYNYVSTFRCAEN